MSKINKAHEMEEIAEMHSEWCKMIANARTQQELIEHFREHVGDHFDRHNREGKLSLDVWIIGCLNFLHILENKFPHLTKADMLYKLCRFHNNHNDGPEPPFDIDEFLEGYDGPIKGFHHMAEPEVQTI
jgi:hypothetical protein